MRATKSRFGCQQTLAGSSTAMGVARNPLLPRPLSQPTGPAISMLPCPSCRACSPLVPRVLQNPLSLTTLQAPSNRNDRKEKNGIRNRLLVVFHACSISLPYLHLQPLPSRGRTDARPRKVCLALALPERPLTLCPHAHLPDWGRCESDPRCQDTHLRLCSQAHRDK